MYPNLIHSDKHSFISYSSIPHLHLSTFNLFAYWSRYCDTLAVNTSVKRDLFWNKFLSPVICSLFSLAIAQLEFVLTKHICWSHPKTNKRCGTNVVEVITSVILAFKRSIGWYDKRTLSESLRKEGSQHLKQNGIQVQHWSISKCFQVLLTRAMLS